MSSLIDPTKPTAVLALTADVRANFAAAAEEISALQQALTGGTSGGAINLADLPNAQPDGSPPVGAKPGDVYINGGFLCIAR